MGATVVDGHGTTHRVPHGHYMHDDEPAGGEGDGPKPSAQLVAKAARKHLQLGPEAPLAVYGLAALLSVGGIKRVHELQAGDVKIDGDKALFPREKLMTADAEVVQPLSMLARKAGKGPVFVVQGQPITEQALTAYVQRFGATSTPGAPPQPEAGGAPMAKGLDAPAVADLVPEHLMGAEPPRKRQKKKRRKGTARPEGVSAAPLAKASASALDLPRLDERPLHSWQQDGYSCAYRQVNGIGVLSITGHGLVLPLHEVARDLAKAKMFAGEMIAELKAGKTPRRGLFQAIR